MGNRTEYILSSMSAPKFDTSAFGNASNQFGNALNVGVRQMDESNKRKSLDYANDYVSNLLGKGDRTSVLAAQGMLPYANERYGKQAENLMGDIRHSEQMKQARDLFDITNKLEKDKLAEDIRVHDLTNKYQMGSLGIQGGQLSELIRHNKAGEKAISDQYASALNTKLATPVQAVYAGKDGKINVTTITTKMLLEHPDLYKSLADFKAQKDQNLTPSQITQRDKIMSGLQTEDPAAKAQFKAYMNAYVNKDNHLIKTSIPSVKLDQLYNEYATAIKDQPWLMNTLISASGDANKGAEMFKMINRTANPPEGFIDNLNRFAASVRNYKLIGDIAGQVDPFGISKTAKEVYEEKKNNPKSSFQKARANGQL